MAQKFKNIIILILLTLSGLVLIAQCPNSNFEFGNFTNWQGKRGSCCPITFSQNGIFAGTQTIVTQGIDPHSCGGLNTVYQGNFSARLGNQGVGSRAEMLSYTFTVTTNTTLVQYAYAVVLQDPGHNDGEQPAFRSRVVLPNGTVIPCTDYFVSAGPNLPGFNYCPEIDILGQPVNVAWSNWKVVTIDLSGYIGQSVTLQFMTNDCALGRHYGYAYIDAISCGPITTTVKYCQSSDSILVQGPTGFMTYEWIPTGDSSRVIVVPTNTYDSLTLHVETMTGCELFLPVDLDPIPLFAEIQCEDACLPYTTNFINLTEPVFGYTTSYDWDFGDGTFSTEYSPNHIYTQPGTYVVTMNADLIGTSCNDMDSCVVTVYDPVIPPDSISHD